MPDLKLGKLPAVRPHALSELRAYLAERPPAPPTSVAVPSVTSFPMDGNDEYGDCVMAGAAHSLQAWNVEVAESDPLPSQQEVVSQYFTLTGGQDTGLNEADTLQTWRQSGLFGGPKIDSYAPVNPGNVLDIHSAIAYYGACLIGIACPQSAQEQFSAGQPWTVVTGSPIEGGHCIVLVGYSPQLLYAVTWGAIAEVTWPFMATYCDEAWAVIPNQFVEAARGPRLDLQSLHADLDSLIQA